MFWAVIKMSICLSNRLRRTLETSEKPFRLFVGTGDDFDLDDVVDEIHTAILPGSLIWSRLGADGERSESRDPFLTNLFDLFGFDFPAVIVFQWQVTLVLFHAARDALGRRTFLAVSFLNGIRFRFRILICSGITP